jgi:hypothetical protein
MLASGGNILYPARAPPFLEKEMIEYAVTLYDASSSKSEDQIHAKC